MDSTTLDVINLGTTGGIVVFTMFLVEVLKRFLCCYGWFNKIPVWTYACVMAAGLAFLANHVIYLDGKPLLTGDNVWLAMWRAIYGAAASSGLYTWLRNPETPETASKMETPFMSKSKIMLLVAATSFMFVVGCACPEKAVLRESLSQAVAPAMAENIDLIDRIANNKPLPHYIPSDVDLRKENQAKVNQLIDQDRKADASKGLFGQ